MFTSTIYYLFFIGLTVMLFRQNVVLKYVNIVVGLIFLISLLCLHTKYIFYKTPQGIVISAPAEVRTGPKEDHSVLFSLPEGKKVYILNQKEDWYGIEVYQKDSKEPLKGWILKNFVEKI